MSPGGKDIAIRVDGVGKRYRIGQRRGYSTLREVIVEGAEAALRRLRPGKRAGRPSLGRRLPTFWALKDVSFEVRRGEVVGIIGHNGAGKSTLLKVLSQITEPTEGEVEIFGRVGSLLEVGTGFHPELTGRDNIFLNGAILGMKRLEIAKRFDEMVAFAEVERFIDTPVKHYSSGMYLRLAFAVAAHLEPDILIVDEVLAVGDARFQKKCLNKMGDVSQQGRTVLFVSHNMPAVTRLCKRAILLKDGCVVRDAGAHDVVGAYLNSGFGTIAIRDWPDPTTAPHGEIARLRAVRVIDEKGEISDAVDIRRPVAIEMEYEVLKPGYVLSPYFDFHNDQGINLFPTVDSDPHWRRRPRPVGRYTSTAWIPGNFLAEGTMFVGAGIATLEPLMVQFNERQVVAFQVVDSMDGDSARGDWADTWGGVVRPLLKWNTQLWDPGAHGTVPVHEPQQNAPSLG